MPSEIQHHFVHTNGIRFHCAVAGSGPLVLLLHGFPECWYSWRHQIGPIADAGFTVVAPDLRGYNDTEMPATGYDLRTLVDDVLALGEAFSPGQPFFLGGHDWGGALAWQTAFSHPSSLGALMELNMPHPTLMARALRGNIQQMLSSYYILIFRLPKVPEWLFSLRNYQAVEQAFRSSAVHRERFSDADMEVYKQAARKTRLTGGLNYYRCMTLRQLNAFAAGGPECHLQLPTLMLWGEKDVALRKEVSLGTEEFVPRLTLQFIPTASHWVQQDEPEICTRAMIDFLNLCR